MGKTLPGNRANDRRETMKQYETMVIIDAMISEDGIANEIKIIEDKINSNGELARRDDWGKRKMAYAIEKKTHGYYVIFYYKAESSVVDQLEAGFRLNGNILRWISLADYPMTDIIYNQDHGVVEDILSIEAEDDREENEHVR